MTSARATVSESGLVESMGHSFKLDLNEETNESLRMKLIFDSLELLEL